MNNLYDFYSFSTAPDYEPCVQAPYEGNQAQEAAEEGDRFVRMLYKRFRNLPYGMSFMLKSVPYTSFHYYEVRLRYIPDSKDHQDALLFIEAHMPETWEDREQYDVKAEIAQ